jgi:hypothetical protein
MSVCHTVCVCVCVCVCHIRPNAETFRKRWIGISSVVHVYINVGEEKYCCYIIIRVVLTDTKLSMVTRGEVGTEVCSI